MFELNETTRFILGKPNFTTGHIAHRLNELNYKHKSKPKAEDEQAVVIYWMLSLYDKYGDNWAEEGDKILKGKK